LHAITDALLGAIAGPRPLERCFRLPIRSGKNADSAVFLREALKRVKAAGLRTRERGFHANPVNAKNRPARGHDSQNTSAELLRNCRGLRRHQSKKRRKAMGTENAAIANVAALLKRC